MICPAGRGPYLSETIPGVGWLETGSNSSMSRLLIYIDGQGIQDLVLAVWRLVIPGIRKPAPDHRPSQLLVQQPLVLFILSILSIDVNNGKKSIPGADPASSPTASAFACRLGFCDSPSRGRVIGGVSSAGALGVPSRTPFEALPTPWSSFVDNSFCPFWDNLIPFWIPFPTLGGPLLSLLQPLSGPSWSFVPLRG